MIEPKSLVFTKNALNACGAKDWRKGVEGTGNREQKKTKVRTAKKS